MISCSGKREEMREERSAASGRECERETSACSRLSWAVYRRARMWRDLCSRAVFFIASLNVQTFWRETARAPRMAPPSGTSARAVVTADGRQSRGVAGPDSV